VVTVIPGGFGEEAFGEEAFDEDAFGRISRQYD
jgi:hypothetical protein